MSKGKKSIQRGTNIMVKDRQTKRTTTGEKKGKKRDHQKHPYEGNCINFCESLSVIEKSID